jgi:nucleotide-binding universal stress UspA family protein
MLPIHTILHPTDFSEHSEFAFRLACALARDYGAHLVVLHVEPWPAIVYSEGIVPPITEDENERLRDKLHAIEAPDFKISVEHRLEEGDPIDRILAVATETNADLIVMGTHGRTGLGRLLMGSVAEPVLRRATCPVVTVRTPFPETVGAVASLAEPAHAPASPAEPAEVLP